MISDPASRSLLQRLLLLMTRIRVCNQECATPADFCETHERDWKRLEKDVRKALGEPGAN